MHVVAVVGVASTPREKKTNKNRVRNSIDCFNTIFNFCIPTPQQFLYSIILTSMTSTGSTVGNRTMNEPRPVVWKRRKKAIDGDSSNSVQCLTLLELLLLLLSFCTLQSSVALCCCCWWPCTRSLPNDDNSLVVLPSFVCGENRTVCVLCCVVLRVILIFVLSAQYARPNSLPL